MTAFDGKPEDVIQDDRKIIDYKSRRWVSRQRQSDT